MTEEAVADALDADDADEFFRDSPESRTEFLRSVLSRELSHCLTCLSHACMFITCRQ